MIAIENNSIIIIGRGGGDDNNIVMHIKRKIFVLGLLFFITMTVSGIYALSDSIDSIENPLSLAYVDINLETEQDSDDVVLPGDEVDFLAKVTNLGIDCYLRFKMEITVKDSIVNYDRLSIDVDSSKWKLVGDYYYYTSVLTKDKSVTIFDDFVIPKEINNDLSNEKISIKITAEAIQALNFEPDYDNSSPWGDVPIDKKVDREYSLDQDEYQTIIYENDADEYLDVDSGFFNGLVNLVPGDSKEDFIDINASKKIKVFISLNTDKSTEEELKILSKIRMKIVDSSNNTLYDDALANNKINYLKSYEKNQSDKLRLIISVPSEMNNEYSSLLTKVIWVLSCEEIEDEVNPKTGDSLDMSIIVFIISFIGFIAMLIIGMRDREDREDN